jgi:hypothetical protein
MGQRTSKRRVVSTFASAAREGVARLLAAAAAIALLVAPGALHAQEEALETPLDLSAASGSPVSMSGRRCAQDAIDGSISGGNYAHPFYWALYALFADATR